MLHVNSARLEADLEFLSRQGFNYYRMLSMVGYNAGWKGLEVAPVSFRTREDRRVEAWPDYWRQLRELIDLAYDRYGLRTQITVFADAQLMPDKKDRLEHMRKIIEELAPGREHKIILLEVANEAWQNGFPGDEGVADLREFATFLSSRTEIPVAITSNHDWPELGSATGFEQLYADGVADVATWHFSRDRRSDDGWKPVYDCWEFGDRRRVGVAPSARQCGRSEDAGFTILRRQRALESHFGIAFGNCDANRRAAVAYVGPSTELSVSEFDERGPTAAAPAAVKKATMSIRELDIKAREKVAAARGTSQAARCHTAYGSIRALSFLPAHPYVSPL